MDTHEYEQMDKEALTRFEAKKWRMSDIRQANKASGHHFFDRPTLQFFNSRVERGPYQGPGGIFFVTSEKYDRRVYNVRKFYPESGRVKTANGKLDWYTSLDDARDAAKELAKG